MGTDAAPLNRVASTLLILLAFLLPFEAPIGRIGRLQITLVELCLYATLAVWMLSIVFVRHRATSLLESARALVREPLSLAVILWGATVCASAIVAPYDQMRAIKFALRSVSGILLFFAVRSLAREPDVARRVPMAIATGALVSAVTAALDWWLPTTRTVWRYFGAGSYEAFGLVRASGVFEYPTVAAMYWEAAIPLVVIVPLLAYRDRRVWRDVGISAAASALLGIAILGSATRSAVAGALIACVLLLVVGWRWGSGWRRATLAVAGAIVVSSLCVLFWPGSLRGQRLRWWQDDSWFRVAYQVGAVPDQVRADEPFLVPVTLRNTGTRPWARSGDNPVRLSYHWETVEGSKSSLAAFEGMRTELPADVMPDQSVQLMARARAPRIAGRYRLRWDVVQERVVWFSERGNAAPESVVQVEPVAAGAPPRAADLAPAPELSLAPPSRPALWRAAVALWKEHPLLGIGPDNFRWRYPYVLKPPKTGEHYTDTRIHANSLYFETLANLGAVGMVVLVLLGIALLRTMLEQLRAGRIEAVVCGVAAASFFVHGVLDYFFEFTPTFSVFWMLMGMTGTAFGPCGRSRAVVRG